MGSAGVSTFGISDGVTALVSSDLRFLADIAWRQTDLALKGGAPLPKQLSRIGLGLGLSDDVGSGWIITGRLQPSLAGDKIRFSSHDFNVGAALYASRSVSATFSFSLGVAGGTRGRYHVLPVAGLQWEFAPDWSLKLGFPSTGIFRRINENIVVHAGVSYDSGSYYIRNSAPGGFMDTNLDFREVRLGLGAVFKLAPHFALDVDGGDVATRRFDYYNRSFQLRSKGGGFVSASAHYRF